MTTHLYYEDSYRTEFTAGITGLTTVGGKPAVILDQTVFYPASGGQPCDTGMLGGVQVESVEEDASGSIVHVLAAPLGITAGPVSGTIDWRRRFDHMQQHTGQHILSQAFIIAAGAATLSFHLGQETSTIDIDLAQPEAAVLRTVEELATRTVFEDRPVRVLNVTREDLAALGIRKESQRQGEIRVIDIEGFDRSACGGTHVRRSGEVGTILILGGERYKGGTRIEFVSGYRALNAFRKDHETSRDLSRLFSAHPNELPTLCEKLLAERSSLVREKKRLQEELLALEALDLVRGAEKAGSLAIVSRTYADRTIESLKILAQKAIAFSGTVVVLAAVQDSAQIVVARSQEVTGDCGAVIKNLAGRLGGRGGGKPELAQVGGIRIEALEAWMSGIIDYFQAVGKLT